jgi:AAA family ATP:ADP antiporter
MIEHFKSLTSFQKKFIALCFGFSFFITFDYSCLRPVSQSLFITTFGSKWLPWVWLLSLPLNFSVVFGFNRFLQKIGSAKLSLYFLGFVLLVNTTLAFIVPKFPSLSLILYLWKDLYILLVFQQLWSQIHASLGSSSARHLYGLMYMFGALGSIAGASLPANLKLPATMYLFSTAMAYPILLFLQTRLLKNPINNPMQKTQSAPSALAGLKKIAQSSPLLTIGLLVALMQMVSALSEFIFSKHLEAAFFEIESRTKASAKVMSFMHTVTLGLQLLFGLISVEKLGLKRGHVMIPSVLASFSLGYLLIPGYQTASYGFISAKSLDFSLFSVLKESLYAPLDKTSVYESKAFIDVFVYRGAKTFMSLILIFFGSYQTSHILGLVLFSLILIWILTASLRLKPILQKAPK